MVIDSPHLFVFFSAPGYSYTAPVWMGEFGQMVRGNYWLNMLSSLVFNGKARHSWSKILQFRGKWCMRAN